MHRSVTGRGASTAPHATTAARSTLAGSNLPFVQRFGDAFNTNLHFHSLILDGVYEHVQGGAVRFRRLPPPTDAEVEETTRRIVRQLRRLLVRRGQPDTDPSAVDPLPEDEPLLAGIYAASVRSRIAMGERAGLGVLRIGHPVDPEEAAFVTGRRAAMIDGVSLRANVSVPAKDRRRSKGSAATSPVPRYRPSGCPSSRTGGLL